MNLFWLLRMKRWVQNPPGPQHRKLIAAVVIAAFLLFGLERVFGWPDWLTVNQRMR
ncbi:MAG: hypothetical protein L3J37_05045 [Rhodobacteraceae bacterium]|nr:hypothetical protein [Paracoccaceae bacterium]